MEDRDVKLVDYLLSHGHTSPFRHAFFTFHIKAPLFTFRQWWKYQVGSTWRAYGIETGEAVALRAYDIQIDTDQGCSWNELSGRYKVMEPEFYMPDPWRGNTGKQAANAVLGEAESAEEARQYGIFCREATGRYNAALERGVAKELARLYLPPTIYSEAIWTVSLQAVLHFLDQRIKPDAQFEIREYAQGVLELIRPDLNNMGVTP